MTQKLKTGDILVARQARLHHVAEEWHRVQVIGIGHYNGVPMKLKCMPVGGNAEDQGFWHSISYWMDRWELEEQDLPE